MIRVVIEKEFNERIFAERVCHEIDMSIHQCSFLMLNENTIPRLAIEQHFEKVSEAFSKCGYHIHRALDPNYCIVIRSTECGMISAEQDKYNIK